MAHIFDVHKKKRLDSEERRRMLTPYETLLRLGYKTGETFADIGCGIGFFTFPAAEIGGSDALIYAVDVSEEMLQEVRQRADDNAIVNIETVLSEAYDFKLKDAVADYILICTVLHEIDDNKRFIDEAKRICRPSGKIAVIEFNDKDAGFGPDKAHRLSPTQVIALLEGAGFTSFETTPVGDLFYAVTAIG